MRAGRSLSHRATGQKQSCAPREKDRKRNPREKDRKRKATAAVSQPTPPEERRPETKCTTGRPLPHSLSERMLARPLESTRDDSRRRGSAQSADGWKERERNITRLFLLSFYPRVASIRPRQGRLYEHETHPPAAVPNYAFLAKIARDSRDLFSVSKQTALPFGRTPEQRSISSLNRDAAREANLLSHGYSLGLGGLSSYTFFFLKLEEHFCCCVLLTHSLILKWYIV